MIEHISFTNDNTSSFTNEILSRSDSVSDERIRSVDPIVRE